jgi:phosphate transport system substrate-binding protein
MTIFARRLILATMLTGAGGMANAQTRLPAAELRGAGSSAVAPALVAALNCIGQPNADLNGNLTTLPSGLWFYGTNYGEAIVLAPARSTGTRPCTTSEVQPDFEAKYIGMGTDEARRWWRGFANVLDGAPGRMNPFVNSTYPAWSNLQLAFVESPLSNTDITAYNANARGADTVNGSGPVTLPPVYNRASAPIAIPLFIVPVAFAYLPTYGYNASGQPLAFNVKVPVKVTANGVSVTVGGLRLSREAYCRIWNGDITNWNHPLLQRLNGGSATNPGTSLRSGSDNIVRWSEEGAPIRLVGRFDTAGTTDVFTRHLAAACVGITRTSVTATEAAAGNGAGTIVNNRYATNAEALPYSTQSGINLSGFGLTRYNTGNTASVAGTSNMISGAFFDRTTHSIVTSQGSEAAGRFMVATGDLGVATAVAEEGSSLRASTNPNGIGFTLNGKLGYVSADYVVPTVTRINSILTNLHSAAVARFNSTTSFVIPNATNAKKAFSTVLPPQSSDNIFGIVNGVRVLVSPAGAFSTDELRTSALGGTLQRSRPQDWTQALYPTAATGLANPVDGYPITGVTSLLTYSCFATPAKRLAAANTIGLLIRKVTRDHVNSTVQSVFQSPNIDIVPSSWTLAINETFLKKSSQVSSGVTLGALNLWIQSAAPTSPATVASVTANPSCTSNVGA